MALQYKMIINIHSLSERESSILQVMICMRIQFWSRFSVKASSLNTPFTQQSNQIILPVFQVDLNGSSMLVYGQPDPSRCLIHLGVGCHMSLDCLHVTPTGLTWVRAVKLFSPSQHGGKK